MNVLLPVCVSLAVLGVVIAVLLWLRGRRGRAVQAFGVGALPVGLYLTGLLGLVWNAGVALSRWAAQLVFNPAVWTGVGLIGLAVVLWVVGGFVARRTPARPRVESAPDAPAVGRGPGRPKAGKPKQRPASTGTGATGAGDGEFDEIEELLRKRGIE